MKHYLIKLLRKWLSGLLKTEWEAEHKKRIEIIGSVLYKNAGDLLNYGKGEDDIHHTVQVIESASFNYFSFNDLSIPRFDFVLSNTPLYIIVGTPFNSSKETAINYGCTEEQWAENVNKLAIIETALPKLEQINLPAAAKFLFFDWNEPISEEIVYLKLVETLVDQH